MRKLLYILISVTLFLLIFPVSHAQAQTPAFPGAEGFGMYSVGGRGGSVCIVSSLSDSGTGTLRDCVSQSNRTVVFHVGGVINLNSTLNITHSNITIAGQTAPGDGIMIKGEHIAISSHDIIIRYIRIRPGPDVPEPSNGKGILFSPGAHNVIIDHVSLSWTTDETVTFWGNDTLDCISDVTVQWNIIAEPLNNSTHSKGPHGYNILSDRGPDKYTIHHNVVSHGVERSPKSIGQNQEFSNNVIYDITEPSRFLPYFGILHANVVNNFYVRTPRLWDDNEIRYSGEGGADTQWYLTGNKVRNYNETSVRNSTPTCAIPCPTSVSSRFNFPPVTYDTAEQAYTKVLNTAGATLPKRDSVDARIVNDVINGTGIMVDDPSQVGGYPTYNTGSFPADDDSDGMPNSWESQYGFNSSSASDGAQDADGDGYTNLEEYLNNTNPKGGANPSPSPTLPPTTPPTASPTPSPIPGDANDDRRVDGVDYVIWLNHYNQTTSNGRTDGDFNSDRKVDGMDYVIWLNHYS